MSLPARLLNIFADPGEVFEGVRSSRASLANWLVPAALLSIASILLALAMFSQPAIVQQVREQQARAIEDQVSAGKLSQADADQAMAVIDSVARSRRLCWRCMT
jgi:hypothetical protein